MPVPPLTTLCYSKHTKNHSCVLCTSNGTHVQKGIKWGKNGANIEVREMKQKAILNSIVSTKVMELNQSTNFLIGNLYHAVAHLAWKKGSVTKGQLLISLFSIKPHFLLTLWRPATFGDFWEKNIETHMALRGNFSGLVSATDLVKSAKDVASLVACTRKKFFGWGMRIFCEWCHKWGTFRPPWPTSIGPGRQLLDGSISLNFFLETRLQSESCDTVNDLLGFQVQKLWSKIIKIFD